MFSKILKEWNLKFINEIKDVNVDGSSERVISRYVVNCDKGLFVLEEVSDFQRKLRISETLDYLFNKGLKYVNPYLRTKEGEFLHSLNSNFWQLSKYIHGIKLDRPNYLKDSWRGIEAGRFLRELWKIPVKQNNVFSVKDFIIDFFGKLKENNPEILLRLGGVINFLEDSFLYNQFQLRFCHGDFHPLNIIWSEKSILKVIDWEFCGYKPEFYDSANFIGCLSFEHPDSIINDIAINFLKQLNIKDFNLFFSSVLASRIIWLSEWLHKDDNEMVKMEIDHLNLLFRKKDIILKIFKENV